MKRKTLAAAFPYTVPVLMGYLAIGVVFGWMLSAIGYNPLWSVAMSVTIYAGSGQYLGVSLLENAAPLADVAFLVAGSLLGAVAGALITINTDGIDFAMTALFIVIAVDQWRSADRHFPALLGAGATLMCLLWLGPDGGRFLIPALGLLVAGLLLARPKLDKPAEAEHLKGGDGQ